MRSEPQVSSELKSEDADLIAFPGLKHFSLYVWM